MNKIKLPTKIKISAIIIIVCLIGLAWWYEEIHPYIVPLTDDPITMWPNDKLTVGFPPTGQHLFTVYIADFHSDNKTLKLRIDIDSEDSDWLILTAYNQTDNVYFFDDLHMHLFNPDGKEAVVVIITQISVKYHPERDTEDWWWKLNFAPPPFELTLLVSDIEYVGEN